MILDGHRTRRPLQELRGNEPLLLTGRESAWLVESGAAAVFAVRVEDGRAQGHRRYLFTAGAGEILLGAAPAGRALLAVPVEATMLAPLTSHDLTLTDFEQWTRSLCKVLGALAPPSPAAPVGRMSAPGAIITVVGEETRWYSLGSGSFRLMGYEEGLVATPGAVFALAPGIWFLTDQLAEIEEVVPERGSVEPLEAVFFRALDELDRRQQETDRAQFESRQRLNRELGNEALRQLASASGKTRPVSDAAGTISPLLAAAQAVGRAEGLAVLPAVEASRDPLRAIAQASGFRTRQVLLEGRWWRQENGPILAYRGKNPVALLPARRSFLGRAGYELFDPLDGSRQRMTRESAAELEPLGVMFYCPFGEKSGVWDLLAFGTRSYRRDLVMVAICGMMVALLGMAAPQATALLVGQAIPDANVSLLLQVTLGMVTALTGAMLFDLTQGLALLRAHGGLAVRLQTGLWDRLLKLGPPFFRQFSTGELRTRVEGISRIQQQVTLDLLRTLILGVASTANLALMFYYSIPLGAIALLSGMVVLGALILHGRSLVRLEATQQDLDGALSGLMVQLINGVGKLRVAGAEQRAFAHWGNLYSRKQHLAMEIRLRRDRVRLVNVSMPIVAVALAFWFALGRFGGSALPLGTFLAFNVALGTFMTGLANLSDASSGLLSIPNLWRRARTILDAHPEVEPGKTQPGRLAGRVVLDHVGFRYRKDGPLTLDDISLHAEPGECIALVGPSGSGKSTILNLLLRFETPHAGAIYLDGQDLGSLDIAAVRRQLGVVSQDSRLMSESIFENIVCGGLNTMDEVWEAARHAGLAEDIENMPMGMHTIVSEGGSNISGGQRQRMLIARALLRKPSILIFDEATSALDNRTQAIVTESLRQLKATRIVVAHRLSTVRHADRIYVIDSGRMVQQGTFHELAGQPGLFAQLMRRQMA
jgi:NHLM bacteriocin system ABC transporter ATP-binding protein